MYKRLLLSVLLVLTLPSNALVRYNSYTGFWEGNICATQYGWSWYQWQPIGSICILRLPNGRTVQGIIANQ